MTNTTTTANRLPFGDFHGRPVVPASTPACPTCARPLIWTTTEPDGTTYRECAAGHAHPIHTN